MSKKVKFELNRAGVRELLKGQAMMGICSEIANNAQSSLGDGFTVSTRVGANRVNASVIADTYPARKKNAETNCILKAVSGAGNG